MSTLDDSLYWACLHGDKQQVLKLANQNNVNYVHTRRGDTPLHQACKWPGCLDIIKVLIEKYGCDLNVKTIKSNESPLHYACQCGRIEVVELLIEKYGCDPNAVTKNNESLLHYACQYGHIDIVKLLIEKYGCDPNTVTKNNESLLHYACQCGHSDTVKLLIERYGCDPNVVTSSGESLLHYACQYGSIDIVQYLINEQHANPLLRGSDEREPLDYALINNRTDTAVYLCQHCISSDDMLNPNRIKTTIKLIQCIIIEADIWPNRASMYKWTTSNGDNILQLVGNSKICISCISSAVVMKILNVSHTVVFKPDMRTANGDTILQLVCRSEVAVSRISSTVLTKWLSDSTAALDLTKIVTRPDWKTYYGETIFELICQSEKLLIQIPSTVFLKWLKETPLNSVTTAIPDCKTADGDTLLQLVLQSEITMLKTSSRVLVKLLSDSREVTINEMKKVSLNWKTLDGAPFLHTLCQSNIEDETVINIMQYYNGWNPDSNLDSKGNVILHIACQTNKLKLVSYLIDRAHCNPNLKNKNGNLPLDMTTNLEVIKCLCQHDHVVVYSKTIFKWMTTWGLTDDTKMLYILQSLVDNHKYKTEDGSTLLHIICGCTQSYRFRDKISLVKYLLIDCQCDPNCLDSKGRMPLQLISNSDSETMKTLVEHGAQMTTDVVFKLISRHNTDSRVSELFKLSTNKGTMLWNPHDLNSDGYTALHLACKVDSHTIVNYLLSIAHCDPNVKSLSEEVPLQMTTNPEIFNDLIRYGAKTSMMYESHLNHLGTNKPVQPPVKVFIVGNPSAGKSTLTEALKTEKNIVAQLFSSGKVSGIDEKTVGIVPHDLESGILGRVTLYDFAGHREFYSGHAALLQTAIQSTPPIFLLVINLCEGDDEIIKTILYWISFLENQCASVNCKPHIILVGSHADMLKGINSKDKIKMIVDSLDKKCFTNMEYIGCVAMDCQFHASTGMNALRRLLIKSCQELRIHEPITFNAHCFLKYLEEKFINLTGVTIKQVSEAIKFNSQQSQERGVLEFLPESFEAFYKICSELNDRGHILLLKDRVAIESSYIVIDKQFLLSKLSGAIFAPEGFKQYKELSSNTGVVPLSNIASFLFEVDKDLEKDLDILIGVLTHLEFCHEISDHSLHQLTSEQYSEASGERYYLFPGLISLKADDTVWQKQSTNEYDCNFGWILKCIHLEQFFSARFLQVLLLRLAFSFAPEASSDSPNQSIGIHRDCRLWKNGIFWGSEFGMQTLVEVTTDNKSVVLLARFRKANILQCIHLRSAVISTILQCKEQFCSRVIVSESFADSSSPLQYPLNPADTHNTCSLQRLATAIVRDDCKHPEVVFPCSTIPAEIILAFEPYLVMKLPTIQELWDEKNENKVIENIVFFKFVQEATDELRSLIKTFSASSARSTSENELYQHLLRWRDSDKTNKKTYKDLRQQVDQYSVFAGRNVLELVTAGKQQKPVKEVIQKEKGEKEQCKLKIYSNTPKLHELQQLKLPNGTELRIMEKVAPEWEEIAVALGFDGARIKAIRMGTHHQPRKACLEMLTEWLDGGHDLQPPTWDALILSLRAANLIEMADLLCCTVEIESEDATANTLSASSFPLLASPTMN